jgi:Na+/melibiose symporter-like transporter
MKEKKKKYALNYPQILLIGFGFLASSLAWAIYNSQVPLILSERFFLSGTLIGTIMTIDNFFGVIFQPLIGAWSDNTRTRFGRRMPWILFGLPICALLFALIPLQQTLLTFMTFIIAFNLMMALWRSPVISLMPDVTPSPLRSEANGIINMMGGVGSIIAFFLGGILSDIRPDKFYAFLMATLVMVFALIILFLFIREPAALRFKKENKLPIRDTLANRWSQKSREDLAAYHGDTKERDDEKQRSLTAFLALSRAEKTSLIALLIAIFAWFLGYNAIETFFTLYARNTYGITGGQATMMLTGFSLTFLIFAVPAGLLAQKIGRKRTILIGLIGIIVLFLPILARPSQWLVQVLLIAGGACWSCININSLPMVLEFSADQSVGSFTGYYYLFSFTAAIVSPITYGAIQDYFQTEGLLFFFSVICFALALISMFFVKHGDSEEIINI